jgi:AcrR family transcriptional regulator
VYLNDAIMRTRLRRVEQVERNRELVLAAARRVFLEKGYGAATVEEIAEAAGFSRGVIYSQFDGKADLFMALLEARIAERAAENEAIVRTRSGREAVLGILRRGEADAEREPGWPLLLVEFRALAARDPVLSARYAKAHSQTVARLTAALESAGLRRADMVGPEDLARTILALSTGLPLERAADPQALPAGTLDALVLRLMQL